MRLDIGVVNYNTDLYLRNLLASIEAQLPSENINAIHVWDNGSTDRSLDVLAAFDRRLPQLRAHRSAVNLHHGRALDLLLRRCCEAQWVLLLDSDAEIARNFVPHLPRLDASLAFVGQIHPDPAQLYAYLAHLLVNRTAYLDLPPFRHHGAPGLDFFRSIEHQQIPYVQFRWWDYVRHFGQGTLRRLVDRQETANEFYAFANEQADAPRSFEQDALEAALEGALVRFLEGTGHHASSPCTRPMEADHLNVHQRTNCGTVYDNRGRLPLLPRLLDPQHAFALRRARRLGLVQRRAEIQALFSKVRRVRPRRALEIGTAHGGTFYLWTRAAAPDALLVSLDLPPWERDDPGEARNLDRFHRFARERQQLRFIRADSHDKVSREQVVRLLGSAQLDFLFIDGDHSYEGVKQDFADYAALVRPGGLVALHDIQPHSKGWGGEVPEFWREIRPLHRHEEIVEHAQQDGFGIGLISI